MANDGRTWTLAALAALTAGAALTRKGSSAKPPKAAPQAQAFAEPQSAADRRLHSQGRAVAQQRGVRLMSLQKSQDLAARARAAYAWITENAVYVPVGDMEFGTEPATELAFTHRPTAKPQSFTLRPQGEAYNSFVLLPLLNLFVQKRVLLVGGPGRSKTTIAMVLSLIAGVPAKDMKRFIVRGHPQLTVADLLGAPLPAAMMTASELKGVKVSWKDWIKARVKLIDEYNRIPTKTQSALLSLMAEGEAEQFDQPTSIRGQKSGKHGGTWFLTANDDLGGGTFQVIQALKDRIDVVVRAVPFSSAFIDNLLTRVERGQKAEDLLDPEILFTTEELDGISDVIASIHVPEDVLERIGFFMGQLDFCRRASRDIESMNKDTLKLAGKTVSDVCNEQCPLDKAQHLCTQTETGLSARTFETILVFSKALAWFRGETEVSWQDMKAIVPWVTRDKLQMNESSGFFEKAGNQDLLLDKTAWIRNMLAMSEERWRDGQVQAERKAVHREAHGLQAAIRNPGKLTASELDQRSQSIIHSIKKIVSEAEFSGWVYEDVLELKRIYQGYRSLLRSGKIKK